MPEGARPAISVVMIVGTNRVNAQGVLDALSRRCCPDDLLEIVVFDCAAESEPSLKMPTRFTSKYLRRPSLHYWRVARALAAENSTPGGQYRAELLTKSKFSRPTKNHEGTNTSSSPTRPRRTAQLRENSSLSAKIKLR